MDEPRDLSRLMQEALAQLGSTADPAELASQVQRLNIGLPAEDEFSVICAWLGQCKLLHKLDQFQLPKASVDMFQVPDLLAIFNSGPPVLIEVKCRANKKLSFTKAYHTKLLGYADALKMPMLIAWKFHSMWMLFDIRNMKLAKTNFNIDLNEAMRQNLLGVLVGDVSYKLAEGAGVHFVFAKEELIHTDKTNDESYTETWQMRVSEVWYTKGGGDKTALHPETGQLFTTWDLAEREHHLETSIEKSFYVKAEGMEFGHRALVHLLDWEGRQRDAGGWRALTKENKITRSVSDFRAALERAMSEGVVSHVFHQVPVTLPDFLAKSTEATSLVQ